MYFYSNISAVRFSGNSKTHRDGKGCGSCLRMGKYVVCMYFEVNSGK